jgi:hypothetical protein
MASITNRTKNASTTLTGQTPPARGATVFYGWMFWFTRPVFSNPLSNLAVNAGSLINQSKN